MKNIISLKWVHRLLFSISAIFVVLVLWLVFAAEGTKNQISPISTWKIVSLEGFTAQILWQKSVPCLTTGYSTPYGAIAVSENQLILHTSCTGFDGSLTSLNLMSGEQTWVSQINNVYQITTIKDGYLAVFDDSLIRKINFVGEKIWDSEPFSSRSMRAVFPQGDIIYAPFKTSTNSGVYVVSQETGHIIDTSKDANIIALFDDYVVKKIDGNTIQVIQTQNQEMKWSISSHIPGYNLSFVDVQRSGDILLLYSGREYIDAYNIVNGEKLWTIDQNFGSYPLLLENKLFLYTLDNTVAVYDVRSGIDIGKISLSRSGSINIKSGRPESDVAIGGYKN
ncbi:MAG: hypothetical protein K8F30_03895, partial [Taibaiella sp.]|nr:hypothetical protein [Taibaiella sp.]